MNASSKPNSLTERSSDSLLQSDAAAGLVVRRKSDLHLVKIIILQKSERSESPHYLSKLVHGLASTQDGKISRLVLGGKTTMYQPV